jgi:hypothetical protein
MQSWETEVVGFVDARRLGPQKASTSIAATASRPRSCGEAALHAKAAQLFFFSYAETIR